MADAAAPAIATMDAYLEQTLGVANQGMRDKIVAAGFTNMDVLVKKADTFAHQACQTVRKSSTGQAASKDVTMAVEEALSKLVLVCKYRYITQRPLAYNQATLDNLDIVWDWFSQLEDDPSEDSVPNFTDSSNRKQWFESITGYLAVKKGKSGVPLLYVIRQDSNLPADDPGFGLPTLNEELVTRGRHNGHFWAADNRSVWLFLRAKCHGTTAWNTILTYQTRSNGRAAFLALLGQYLGEDVRAVLLKKAEQTLETIRFDGRSRNWPFDKFIGKLRESFNDLGPDNQLTEERKVNKLMSAWQVPALQHLDATIQSNPQYRTNFNACVNFLSNQMSNLRTKNGPINRNVASATTLDGDSKLIQQLKAQVKSLQAKHKKSGGGKGKDKPHKKKQDYKNNKDWENDLTAYVPAKKWFALSADEKERRRAAKDAAGIAKKSGKRGVGSLSTKSKSSNDATMEDAEEEEQAVTTVATVTRVPAPPQFVPVQHLKAPLVKPVVKKLTTTQRAATYGKKKSKEDGEDGE